MKRTDGSFAVEVPASHFAHCGFVRQGVQIWCAMTGSAEPFCLAFADLDVVRVNPTAIPGRGTWAEIRVIVDALEARVVQVEQHLLAKIDDPTDKEEGQYLAWDGGKWTAVDLPEPEDPTKLYSEDRTQYLVHNGSHYAPRTDYGPWAIESDLSAPGELKVVESGEGPWTY